MSHPHVGDELSFAFRSLRITATYGDLETEGHYTLSNGGTIKVGDPHYKFDQLGIGIWRVYNQNGAAAIEPSDVPNSGYGFSWPDRMAYGGDVYHLAHNSEQKSTIKVTYTTHADLVFELSCTVPTDHLYMSDGTLRLVNLYELVKLLDAAIDKMDPDHSIPF